MKTFGIGVTFALALIIAACGGSNANKAGEHSKSSTIATVKLKDLLKNPAAFKNQEVRLEGAYGQYCCDTDFSYREGLDSIEVVTSFNAPKFKTGRQVVVFGVVRTGEKREDSDKEKGEKTEEAHHDVHIEAKEVQVK